MLRCIRLSVFPMYLAQERFRSILRAVAPSTGPVHVLISGSGSVNITAVYTWSPHPHTSTNWQTHTDT